MNIGPTRTYEGKKPFTDVVEVEFQPSFKGNSVAGPAEASSGVPSIFNPYAIVVFPSLGYAATGSSGAYNKLYDGGSNAPGSSLGNLFSPNYLESNPTISSLVEDAKLADKTPYFYTDFLYCKYVGKIPNNQLITLRRYPAPTFDNLAIPGQIKGNPSSYYDEKTKTRRTIADNDLDEQKEFYPIAQAVTWFGEETGNKLSELLSFTVNMNWKSVEAEVNTAAGNEQGSEDSPAKGVAQFLGILTGQVNTPFSTQNAQYDPYNGGPYSHRVYGPVNVISKTYKRDRGLDFKQSISLNFEYSLKSIGNINPKAAMLDLISNLLALTYNNAAFWGGANRYFPNKPTYPFLGGKDGMNAWYRGEPVQFAESVGKQVSSAMSSLGDALAALTADPIGELKKLATGAAKLGMIEMGKGRAPSIVALKSLLTGEPIGEWHMVVGNPRKPIAQIGNLICTESKFQFNDIIGADNFPTELKVTITVEHGRPRDAGDIQSMFNDGQGRIYYPPSSVGDKLNASSATKNSTNDTSWKSGNGGIISETSKVGIFTGSSSEFDQLLGIAKNMASSVSGSAQNAWNLADKMGGLRTAAGKTK
jgi:hypothetical protein